MRQKKVFGVVVLAMFCLFATMPVSKVEASTCYVFYYDSECTDLYYPAWNYFFVAIHKDGSFDDQFGDWGYWEYFGSSMQLSYWSDSTGCYPMIAGTKKQGFYKCTDGGWSGADWPGCWYMKKTKAYNCPWMD
jgi:hypothetical protein